MDAPLEDAGGKASHVRRYSASYRQEHVVAVGVMVHEPVADAQDGVYALVALGCAYCLEINDIHTGFNGFLFYYPAIVFYCHVTENEDLSVGSKVLYEIGQSGARIDPAEDFAVRYDSDFFHLF